MIDWASPIFSNRDVVRTLRNIEDRYEGKAHSLLPFKNSIYEFASELTGISEDTLAEAVHNLKCYRSISVTDDGSNQTKGILITTVNCDGVYRYWRTDTIEDFRLWWNDDNYGGPESDDIVTRYEMYGTDMLPKIKSCINNLVENQLTFGDLMQFFGIQ